VNWERSNGTLKVRLSGNFNLQRVREVERLLEGVERVEIDLSASRFVDTEAVAFLYRLKRSGKEVILKNPPEILYKLLSVLRISPFFRQGMNQEP